MKANHNRTGNQTILDLVVVNISSSKNESKSQPVQICFKVPKVVVNISSSKNESKSQHSACFSSNTCCCCKYQ